MLTSIALVLVLVLLFAFAQRDDALDIPSKRSFWYIGTPEFFMDPFAFLADSIEQACGLMFSFRVLNNTVIVLRGLHGRDAFFSKGLDFMSGYRLLNPQLVDVMPVTDISGDESWASFMANFIRSEVLERMYPIMLRDIAAIMEGWGEEGMLNPFENAYEVVFTLSVRIATCNEFANDPKKIKTLTKIFERLEAGSAPASILFPWMPTPARIGRFLAGSQLYSMIREVVHTRKREGRREDDPLQVLIDKDFSLVDITRFIAMTLFAAVTNTGNVFCWLLIFLEVNSKWKASIQAEVSSFLQANAALADTTELAGIPLSVMEQHTPSVELCTNETLRMLFTGTFMRRNIGDDIFVSGTRIKHGAFLMYPTSDLHHDSSLYPDPDLFDPTRFIPEALEERRKRGITFLGWGASRHICVGKRVALLMMRMIIVLMMSNFEFNIVDANGKPLSTVPGSLNDRLFKVCQPERPVFLEYRRTSCQGLGKTRTF